MKLTDVGLSERQPRDLAGVRTILADETANASKECFQTKEKFRGLNTYSYKFNDLRMISPFQSALFVTGLEHFNNGRYYEAHEVWEDLWRETDGPAREFYQGLIQAAVAVHHLNRGNRAGAAGLLTKSISNLTKHAENCRDLDVASLIQDLERALGGTDDDTIPGHLVLQLRRR